MKKLIPAVVIIAVIAAAVGSVFMMQGKSVKPQETANSVSDKLTEEPKKIINLLPTGVKSANITGIPLNISSPVNGASVTNATLTVKGKTIARADVVVNDAETTADTSGNFTANITLDEGDNIISILAIDADGNSSEKEMTVTYNPAN